MPKIGDTGAKFILCFVLVIILGLAVESGGGGRRVEERPKLTAQCSSLSPQECLAIPNCEVKKARKQGKKCVDRLQSQTDQTSITFRIDVIPSKTNLTTNEAVSVFWNNSGTAWANDFIAFAPKGAQWGSKFTYFYIRTSLSGNANLNAPSTPGYYELVYYGSNGLKEAARSTTIEVKASYEATAVSSATATCKNNSSFVTILWQMSNWPFAEGPKGTEIIIENGPTFSNQLDSDSLTWGGAQDSKTYNYRVEWLRSRLPDIVGISRNGSFTTLDCSSTQSVCGNNLCETGESQTNCGQDCCPRVSLPSMQGCTYTPRYNENGCIAGYEEKCASTSTTCSSLSSAECLSYTNCELKSSRKNRQRCADKTKCPEPTSILKKENCSYTPKYDGNKCLIGYDERCPFQLQCSELTTQECTSNEKCQILGDRCVQAQPPAKIKLLVLLTKFRDTTTEPYSVSYVQGQVFTNSDSVKQFFEKVSYNRMHVTGDVFGWYTIPYVPDGTCSIKKWMDGAKLVAQQNGVNVGQYTHIVFAFSGGDFEKSGCQYAGEGFLFDVPPRAYVFTPQTSTIIHELGHTLGMGHANGLDCGQEIIKTNYHSTCTISEYLDPFDFMGIGESVGQRLFSFNAPNRIDMGWLLPENVRYINTSGTFAIHALETPSTAVQVLKIKKPDFNTAYPRTQNDYYYIDYNPDVGYDFGKSVDGVMVRIWNQDPRSGTLMLDMTPESCLPSPLLPSGCQLRSDWNDGMLKDGMTFVDNNGIRVTQISHTNTEATVKVEFPESLVVP